MTVQARMAFGLLFQTLGGVFAGSMTALLIMQLNPYYLIPLAVFLSAMVFGYRVRAKAYRELQRVELEALEPELTRKASELLANSREKNHGA